MVQSKGKKRRTAILPGPKSDRISCIRAQASQLEPDWRSVPTCSWARNLSDDPELDERVSMRALQSGGTPSYEPELRFLSLLRSIFTILTASLSGSTH